ncbi:hypothetical protein COEREDRAFT_9743 [Coemansia reversa NRRL 1564]|uniref:Uncharacterized protein n=1 Tax=Coemansia reversa (strain ATCC 12441 / NRRL 1564) TaxID=763665 RepID=A0A2G5B7V6_COERN|nr:hypothetical protein COEREDRAFT_9743 [Coemansia reversa NRRL 1564]|eukprot:PIA15116.1 hypothetical protein COEREDRAFT_9743 [Coemansia reversa NRRL 1564]
MLLRSLPAMARQWAWYPRAYPEAEMQLCPIPDCSERETQGHMFICPAHHWPTYTANGFNLSLCSSVTEIAAEVANTRLAFPGLTDELLEPTTHDRDHFNKQAIQLKDEHTRAPQLFFAELRTKSYDWYKEWCQFQTDKEDASLYSSAWRRRRMKKHNGQVTVPNLRADIPDGLPIWPSTTRRQRNKMRQSYHATIKLLILRPDARVL